jgi:hypothetical protein
MRGAVVKRGTCDDRRSMGKRHLSPGPGDASASLQLRHRYSGGSGRGACDNRRAMRTRWWLVVIWAGFSARLAFYATAYPLWEGFDEWAHFAVVRHMAEGAVLVPRDARLPPDVAASLRYAPVAPTAGNLPVGATPSESDYAAAYAGAVAYEALQPPLYYWLMTPVLWLSRTGGLVTQVFLLRWASIVVASLIVPFVFLIGRETFADDRTALGMLAVVSLMPELAITVARVGNECLGVVLYTSVTWLAIRRRSWLGLGLALGFGLITKAYFLAAVIGAALVYFDPRALAVAAALSGWWYVRNLFTTGTLSGLSESVMLRGTPLTSMLRSTATVPWLTAIDSILFSHLYFGGWSSLMVRSWMYHLFYLVIAVAAVGLTGCWRRKEIRRLAVIYAVFWVAQLYNVILIYRTKGVPTSMGWYLYAVVGAEAALTVAGLMRIAGRWAIGMGAVLFGLLDLYVMNAVALPYYAGMLGRKSNGALAAFHFSGFRPRDMFQRLAVLKPPGVTEAVIVLLWGLYILGTVMLIVVGVKMGVQARWGSRAERGASHAVPPGRQ